MIHPPLREVFFFGRGNYYVEEKDMENDDERTLAEGT
jgi:hypothetical protein